ncbi:hypothetical protein DTO271G3_6154 [Paecilomyces variotii]|nr:hypothetical protein DTO271G3_6154 [Paecilomyces variotii]
MDQNGRSDHLGINRRRRQARVKSGCRTCNLSPVRLYRPGLRWLRHLGRRRLLWQPPALHGIAAWRRQVVVSRQPFKDGRRSTTFPMVSAADRHEDARILRSALLEHAPLPGGPDRARDLACHHDIDAVHRREFLHLDIQKECAGDAIDDQEQFMLRHYTKAIGHLRSHTPDKSNRSSVRIALIACVVFVCLEYLRGRFRTAETHLQSGLKVLSELRNPSSTHDKGIIRLQQSQGDIDDWIVEAFSKLYLQVVLLRQRHQDPCIILQDSITMTQIPRFRSFDEAWEPMERLLSQVLYLTEQFRHAQDPAASLSHEHPSTLGNCQQLLQTELAQWFAAYEASRQELCRKDDEDEGIAYQMLGAYHAMITIMAQACRWPDDESLFDLYTDQFIAIIDRLIVISKIRATRSQPQALPGQGHCPPMSRSAIHIGWTPPLYYTALKCRVHRIRLQAVRLLESSSRREGIWDGSITACVARRVIRIEERDFYRDLDTAVDFDLNSSDPMGSIASHDSRCLSNTRRNCDPAR